MEFCNLVLIALGLSTCMSSILVSGDYQLEVSMTAYDIPSNRAADGECCDHVPALAGDSQCTGEERCDIYFTYCLRSLGTGAGEPRRCDGAKITSTVNQNNAAVNFSLPVIQGLSNPFTLPGLTKVWMGVELYVEILDSDGGNSSQDDLIHSFHIRLNKQTVAVGMPSFQGAVDVNKTFLLATTVRCVNLTHGENCELLDTVDQCVANSVSCPEGQVCVDGTNSHTCECAPTHTGDNCQQTNLCLGQNCNERGICRIDNEHDFFVCDCEAGFAGGVCEVDINECIGVTCSGRGNCTDRVNGFVCDCLPGYTGDECETDINECEVQDCSGNGQCADLVGTFECDCLPGYTGSLCETNIDDCVGVNCSGNGECVDGVNSYRCVCDSGHTGELCSMELQDRGLINTERLALIVGVSVSGVLLILMATIITAIGLRRKRKRRGQEVTSPPINNPITMATNNYGECSQEKFMMSENEIYDVVLEDNKEPYYDYIR